MKGPDEGDPDRLVHIDGTGLSLAVIGQRIELFRRVAGQGDVFPKERDTRRRHQDPAVADAKPMQPGTDGAAVEPHNDAEDPAGRAIPVTCPKTGWLSSGCRRGRPTRSPTRTDCGKACAARLSIMGGGICVDVGINAGSGSGPGDCAAARARMKAASVAMATRCMR